VRLAWRKLRPYIEEERRCSGSQKTLNGSNGLTPTGAAFPGKTSLEVGAHRLMPTGNRECRTPLSFFGVPATVAAFRPATGRPAVLTRD